MTLSNDEISIIAGLRRKLSDHQAKNRENAKYYEGKQALQDFRISIPPQLSGMESVVGWPGTAVQVLEERLDFEGWAGPDTFGLEDVYRANDLDVESSLGHLDALIYGTGFIAIGSGQNGEPNPLITIESPQRMTGFYDLRKRRLTSAIAFNFNDRGEPESGTLYLPDSNIQIVFESGTPKELSRDQHNLGRVTVVQLPNNPRSSDPYGRSEITPAVKAYTQAAMRTLLGAEIAREFSAAPQRYILGASENAFTGPDGNNLAAWDVYQGKILGIPTNEDGQIPQVGQFSQGNLQPYFEQVRTLAQMLAAETAIPPSYLGFQTDNPASADAIRQMESRLVKRAERRQKQFGRAWVEVARLALLIRDGELPEGIGSIRPNWRDAATPTRAAAADEAVKLIGAGVLLPNSEITYDRIGLSDNDKEILTQEKRANEAGQLAANLATAARAAINQPRPGEQAG